MQFLVRIEVTLPPEMPDARRDDLASAEYERGCELRDVGTISKIWRLPGGLRNVGIWEAEDATALHEAIVSLPMYPWMRTEVHALARHPLDPAE